MYHIHNGTTLFDGDDCIGVAYGWEPGTSVIVNGEEERHIPGAHTDRAKANALLWAAAPDMVDVLINILRLRMPFPEHLFPDTNEDIRNVLTKALGRPVCTWGCGGRTQVFVSDGPDDGHIEPCECRIWHEAGEQGHCGNVLCDKHGDERDTSYDRARLGVAS